MALSVEEILTSMRMCAKNIAEVTARQNDLSQRLNVLNWDIGKLEKEYKDLNRALDSALRNEATPPQPPAA